MDAMHRSGYGVLKQTGKIKDLEEWYSPTGLFVVHGFGWGRKILPPDDDTTRIPRIALVHRYCWAPRLSSFPDAPKEHCVTSPALEKELKGYDIAVFGDNHIGFHAEVGRRTTIVNCGGIIRRKSDEIDRGPFVSILFDDGTAVKHYLDTSIDKFHIVDPERTQVEVDVKAFIDSLNKLGEHGMDFKEAVKNHLRTSGCSAAVRQILLTALEAEEQNT
jgi:hypothetical protein